MKTFPALDRWSVQVPARTFTQIVPSTQAPTNPSLGHSMRAHGTPPVSSDQEGLAGSRTAPPRACGANPLLILCIDGVFVVLQMRASDAMQSTQEREPRAVRPLSC